MSKKFEQGAVEGSTIAIILLAIALIAAGSFAIWSFIGYLDAKNNVDSKISLEVAKAKKDQAEIDEKKYAERAKEPNYEFFAPEDLGKVRFNYPKTWSSYVDSDGSGSSDYFAYFHPLTVPPVPKNYRTQQRFALRVAIYNKSMEDVLKEYEKAVKDGELSSSLAIANGKNATKLEGLFPNNNNKNDRIRGVAYFFKVNDKVLMLKTDAETFRADFDRVLQTIKYN